MALMFAFAGSFFNAVTTVLQREAAQSSPSGLALKPSLMWDLVRRPVWVGGFATLIGGFVCQALALNFGPIASVQPVLAFEMVFLLVVISVIYHVSFSWVEWVSALVIALCLGYFLWADSPQVGAISPSGADVVVALLAGLGCIALTVLGAQVLRLKPAGRAGLLAGAGAISFAYAAFSIKTVTLVLRSNPGHVLSSWSLYALVFFGLLGLFLAQNAFYVGPIGATQSALTIVDPLASILLGVFVLHESLGKFDVKVIFGLVCLGGVAYAVVVLNRSNNLAQYRSIKLPRGDWRLQPSGESGFGATPRGRHT